MSGFGVLMETLKRTEEDWNPVYLMNKKIPFSKPNKKKVDKKTKNKRKMKKNSKRKNRR